MFQRFKRLGANAMLLVVRLLAVIPGTFAALALWPIALAAPALAQHAAPIPAADGKVTRAFLLGHWTDDDDCSNTIEFHADGTFTVPGGGSGLWLLEGDLLTFQGAAGSRSARVRAPDKDTVVLLHTDGSVGRSTRCFSAKPGRVEEPPLVTI